MCRGNILKYFSWVHSLTFVGTDWEETCWPPQQWGKGSVIEPQPLTLSAAGDGALWEMSLVNSSQCSPFATFLLGRSHYLFEICAQYQGKQLCFSCDIIPSVLHAAWMFPYMHLASTWEGWWGTWASLEFIPFLRLKVWRDNSDHLLDSDAWGGLVASYREHFQWEWT